jgi:hypothetical protein
MQPRRLNKAPAAIKAFFLPGGWLDILFMPENLNDCADFEESGNIVSKEPNLYQKIVTGSIVSEYEHAVR